MVFRNLIRNAVKYGYREGMIAVGFEDQGSCYRLNVFNSGEPVPEEYRERLFTRSISDRDVGKQRAGGTGLGLYLVQKVIQKLGGNIWYEPRENGSNFVFTLLPMLPPSSDTSLPTGARLQMSRAYP
jgi:signal transduction histidine kinase